MGHEDKKRAAAELAADATWFGERMSGLVDELKTAKGRRAEYLRECLTGAMNAHAYCTREAVGEGSGGTF